MRQKILSLVTNHGPITADALRVLTGIEDKPIRNAIDQLRADGEPICHSSRGFWLNPGFVPPSIPYGRWKCEPLPAGRSEPNPTARHSQARTVAAQSKHLRFKTPFIPSWIKELSCPPYVNIFSLGLNNKNLFGTETLLGDWDGPLLVVAKDFAPAEEVRPLAYKLSDPRRAYHHNDGDGRYHTGFRTNTRLLRFIYGSIGSSMIGGARNLDCGALYVSACFLLKPGDSTSSSLEGWRPGAPAFDQSARVFSFVLENMPNLKAIACLGVDSSVLVRNALPSTSHVFLGNLPHPSRGSNADHEAAWAKFLASAGIRSSGGTVLNA